MWWSLMNNKKSPNGPQAITVITITVITINLLSDMCVRQMASHS